MRGVSFCSSKMANQQALHTGNSATPSGSLLRKMNVKTKLKSEFMVTYLIHSNVKWRIKM